MRWPMRRGAFSLVELLVAVSIILVLMAMLGGALMAARNSGKKQATEAAIAAIAEIIQRHYATAESRGVGDKATAQQRAAKLRRQITADMPDSWEDVRYLKTHPAEFPSGRHRGYVATLDAVKPTDQYGDAECLFMVIMQGGIADCLTCTTLANARKGDKDGDGAMEFWDAWDEPIHYVLWPGGFELPPGTRFFSTDPPFQGGSGIAGAPGPMRPLIYSNGPDKEDGLAVHGGAYLALGNACGSPTEPTISTLGGPNSSSGHQDNITNFDREKPR